MSTTMHFGPEWMRTKHQPLSRAQQPPSPPPTSNSQSGLSTYSALVSSIPALQNDKHDEAHPFRYSKEELLRIYKESPKGGLGLEVERWEGVVREAGSDPVGLREMAESEKKLFAGPLNSDLRRRQSTDYLSPLNMSSLGTERPRLSHNSSSATGSPLRERYPALKRRDSNADSPTAAIPRKQSLSTLQAPTINPRNPGLPSPRTRPGYSGFDGVLNAGETWTSRRRASEASLKPGGVAREASGGDQENGGKASGIQEEQNGEFDESENQSHDASSNRDGNIYARTSSPQANSTVAQPSTHNRNISAALPGSQDLASVEWSYKDPSGNVQGPFRADLMQKWFDDGYFSLDLPMKRTQLDTTWITVDELTKRATSDKIFLSTLLPPAPPGLSKPDGAPMQAFLQQGDQNVFSNPYQPAPVRSLRSSTLDSFTGSNPSDSPASSLGHFGNNSPDSLAYGGRAHNGNPYIEPNGNLAFSGGIDLAGLRRNQLQDFAHDASHTLHSPSYGGVGLGVDGYGFSGGFNPVQASPWGTASQNSYPNYNPNLNLAATSFGGGPGYNVLQNGQIPNQNHGGQINPLLYGNQDLGGHQGLLGEYAAQNQFNTAIGITNLPIEQQNYPNPLPQEYSAPQQYQRIPSSDLTSHIVLSGAENIGYSSNNASPSVAGRVPVAWDTTSDNTARRPGPFDPAHPTILNTSVPPVPSQPSPWGQNTQPSQSNIPPPKDASSWGHASQVALQTSWVEATELVASAVDQQADAAPKPDVRSTAVEAAPEVPEVVANAALSPSEASPTPAVPSTKIKTKATASPQSSPHKATSETSPSPVQATQKTPWAKGEKKKVKGSGAAISLREIQDAEAKAAEARKTEKEKERANRLAAAAAAGDKDDVQPFTTSWGLPTSQAGGRSASIPKDSPSTASTPVTPTPPVWTTAVKPPVAKKTMKEIQEEEEKRKKVAVKETVAAATAKRGYAESTNKVASPAPSATNSAWVTVGAGGKAPAAAAPVRPTLASVASASVNHASSSTRPSSATVVRSSTVVSAVKPSASLGSKVDDFPVTPSHEFLKWLSESLKGLNNSVNVEEIISMLLSFSLDPDPLTVEIISDTIYASSTTLDGRRFAAEFVAKRKSDAANRPKGATTAKGAAKVSIADVVKATPKAAQPEWGFKVVNKKKKGGRA